MRKFVRVTLHEDIVINKLISFHYTELTKDYVYPGEKHNFWEFLYMDKGEAEINIADRKLHVKQGELVFYSPNEFHSMRANRRVAPNIMIISFDCKSDAMGYFRSKLFRLSNEEQRLLSEMLREGCLAFDVGKPKTGGIKNKTPRVFGAEQLIKLYLEMMLLKLVRKQAGIVMAGHTVEAGPDGGDLMEANAPAFPGTLPADAAGMTPPLAGTLAGIGGIGGALAAREPGALSSTARMKSDADICLAVKELLDRKLGETMKLDELSRKLNTSKTRLKAIFKRETGYTILEYYNRQKIERAKTYIREETLNYTQIAEKLGYSSIHYFSRHFKQVTDMSPSQYDKSLRARVLDRSAK